MEYSQEGAIMKSLERLVIVADEVLVTTARGAVTKEVFFAKNVHTGRFQLRLELDEHHAPLASVAS